MIIIIQEVCWRPLLSKFSVLSTRLEFLVVFHLDALPLLTVIFVLFHVASFILLFLFWNTSYSCCLYIKLDVKWDSKDFHVFAIASFIGGIRIILVVCYNLFNHFCRRFSKSFSYANSYMNKLFKLLGCTAPYICLMDAGVAQGNEGLGDEWYNSH